VTHCASVTEQICADVRRRGATGSDGPADADSAEKLRVLLVEDERDLADVTKMGLEMEGLDVIVAYDGREALVKPVYPKELAASTRKAWRRAHDR